MRRIASKSSQGETAKCVAHMRQFEHVQNSMTGHRGKDRDLATYNSKTTLNLPQEETSDSATMTPGACYSYK